MIHEFINTHGFWKRIFLLLKDLIIITFKIVKFIVLFILLPLVILIGFEILCPVKKPEKPTIINKNYYGYWR